ncbi:EAL domain-containing protein [Brenneria izadpanahii]|uniref:EAL domain-containing protein n=1 Tax=Brenneria izadpanahii TaxID=2722756 RepID=A0ABX7UYE7_9GAMM|nr:EAL domain-containing protein [Brenneria izadpanahii]QTF10844.1 EAL domain-containing protein [Brenneria izadpanahii]
MYSFVARQPIFDRNLNTVAYELLFRNGLNNTFPSVSDEYATKQMISDQFLCTPHSRLVGNYSSFINFPYQMIIQGLADALPREEVVIEILENAEPDDHLLQSVQRLHHDGFRIALDDFSLSSEWDRFIPYINFIKFDVRTSDFSDIDNYIKSHKKQLQKVIFLAEKIETYVEFEKYKKQGFELFQGYFYSKPELIKNRRLSLNEASAFQLMLEVNAEEPDFNKIEMIIKRDLSLSYKIMRYAKNFLYRTGGNNNVNRLSLKEIAMYLGKHELRRFVSVACLASKDSITTPELYHTSLIRGRFCELIAEHVNLHAHSQEAFLCGLFSLLDVILDIPLDELFKQVTISETVIDTLLRHEGGLYPLLNLAQLYEQQRWNDAKRVIASLNIPEEMVIKVMGDAIQWTDEFQL